MSDEVRKMKVTGEDIYNVLCAQDFEHLFEKHCENIAREALTNASENMTEKTKYTVACLITLDFDTTNAEIKVKRTLKFPRKDGSDVEVGESYIIRTKDGVGETDLGLDVDQADDDE